MTVATHPGRSPLLLGLALLGVVAASTATGCGITQDELAEELQPMRETQHESEAELAELQSRFERHEERLDELLRSLRSDVQDELEEMDERYEEYQRTALAFKELYDDIDAVRERNTEIYEGVYTMLDAMLDLYKEQATMMRNYSSRTNYVAQRIEGMLEELSEFAPTEAASSAD